MSEIDFEIVSQIFQDYFRTDTISHCDIMKFEDGKVFLIEETVYINKNLLDKNVYQNELSEIVKKMWGTYSILIWYLDYETFRKHKIFILKAEIESRFVKILGKLIKDVRRFKNGAYLDIRFKDAGLTNIKD